MSAHIKTGSWLDRQVFSPLKWAVPGIIPEGFGLLIGPPKLGKSWLVLGLLLTVAEGGKALGAIHTEQRPVLYAALEDGDRRMQQRLPQANRYQRTSITSLKPVTLKKS